MRVVSAALVVAFLAGASSASAQTYESLNPAVKGGVSLVRFTGTDADDLGERVMKFGFMFGASVDVPLNDMWSVQPEALLSWKGASYESTDFFGGTTDGSFNLIYLDVPLLVKWTRDREADTSPFVYAGPSLGLKLRSTFSVDGESDDLEDVTSMDFGIVLGGGFRTGRFTVEGRFTRGLKTLDSENDFDLKHMSVAALFGVQLGSR